MSYSHQLASPFQNTHLRLKDATSPASGMCAVCAENCPGGCEIGFSAVRGMEATYPLGTNTQQYASEKIYPLDFSHFNINGRVFGAQGAPADSETTTVYSASTVGTFGCNEPIPVTAPFILPAMAKLNWSDYFAGAAMFGIPAVIGEAAIKKDPQLEVRNKRVVKADFLKEMFGAFHKYDRGLGEIVLQSNVDDMLIGVPEYALDYCGATAIEIKFGQSAKGIQHMEFIYSLDVALSCKQRGFLIFPDPEDEQVQAEFRRDNGLYFTLFGRLPMWDEETLAQRIKTYREHGARHIAFKMAGYDECDLRRVLTIASANRIDMVTVDGAGGGTGHSPCKMMNEWCQPTLPLLAQLTKILRAMRDRGETLPPVAITGGIASEDQIFKALAFGEDLVDYVAIGRAAMAAAMTAKNIGTQVKAGNTPPAYLNYGSDIAHVFRDAKRLAALYGVKPDALPPGAIGVYSYLSRLQTGLQQLMTLSRKFEVGLLDQSDLIALTPEARALLR
jgi:hypothetical protein